MSNMAPTEGLDGRKIVYDEDGKPYVFIEIYSTSRLEN